MAEDMGDKEDKFDAFTAAGESLGYISQDQAQVLAMRTARETPGAYGASFVDVPMAFEVVNAEDTEDHYVITMSFRPQGQFKGNPGQEQFFIEKEGTVAHRNLLSLPRAKRGGFPKGRVAIGLGIVAVIAVVGVAFTIGRNGDQSPDELKQVTQVGVTPFGPTDTPITPGPTDTPITPGPTIPEPTTPAVITSPNLPERFVLNIQGIPVGPGQP